MPCSWFFKVISVIIIISLRGEGWLGFPDLWSGQKPCWNWYYPWGQFRWSPEGPVSQIHSPHLHVGVPGIFSDLLRSVQMLKREWSTESNGKLPHLFIRSKTATLVPEFAVEDLSLGRSAALVLGLQWKTCPWAEHSRMIYEWYYLKKSGTRRKLIL